jgi:VWFA-related protein
MKRSVFIIFILFVTGLSFSQQSFIEQTFVINVEVPVRVFQGNRFIDNLTIQDFEIFEDGIRQKVEAVYLIKRKSIERSDEKKRFRPETARCFHLFFEVSEYSPKLQDALDYFMQNVFTHGDQLVIITPLKTYKLKEDALKNLTRDDILKELKELLRRDAISGDNEYRNTLNELQELAINITSDINRKKGLQATVSEPEPPYEPAVWLNHYAGLMSRLQTLRKADELRLLDLAEYFKTQPMQNYVFIFYERKFIPQLDPRLLDEYVSIFEQESYIQQTLMDILDYNKKENMLDYRRISRAFADTSTAIHFMHITRPQPNVPGLLLEEHSADTYNILREIAHATGGFTESSSNPDYLFKHALDSSENYYLLYYTPKNPKGDGSFKKINVRIKDKPYQVLHRLGYYDY